MIPSNIDVRWYRTYWFGELPRETDRPAAYLLDGFITRRGPKSHVRRRVDPALLALVVLFAALAIGAVLIAIAAPVPPADLPYFLT